MTMKKTGTAEEDAELPEIFYSVAEELPYCLAGGEQIYGEWSHHASSMGMAVATMVVGGKTFGREVAGVLFDSIGEALVSTKSIVPVSKERLIKKHWHAAQEDTLTAAWGGRWRCQHGAACEHWQAAQEEA